jgi:hypothetical protein
MNPYTPPPTEKKKWHASDHPILCALIDTTIPVVVFITLSGTIVGLAFLAQVLLS